MDTADTSSISRLNQNLCARNETESNELKKLTADDVCTDETSSGVPVDCRLEYVNQNLLGTHSTSVSWKRT